MDIENIKSPNCKFELRGRYRILFDTFPHHIDPYRQFIDPSPPHHSRRLLWTTPKYTIHIVTGSLLSVHMCTRSEFIREIWYWYPVISLLPAFSHKKCSIRSRMAIKKLQIALPGFYWYNFSYKNCRMQRSSAM